MMLQCNIIYIYSILYIVIRPQCHFCAAFSGSVLLFSHFTSGFQHVLIILSILPPFAMQLDMDEIILYRNFNFFSKTRSPKNCVFKNTRIHLAYLSVKAQQVFHRATAFHLVSPLPSTCTLKLPPLLVSPSISHLYPYVCWPFMWSRVLRRVRGGLQVSALVSPVFSLPELRQKPSLLQRVSPEIRETLSLSTQEEWTFPQDESAISRAHSYVSGFE